jgi:hypothetical protein
MDRKIFENLFHEHCVPECQAFLKERGLSQKTVLLLGNAPSHQRDSILTSDSGFFIKFFPLSVTAVTQPMTKK